MKIEVFTLINEVGKWSEKFKLIRGESNFYLVYEDKLPEDFDLPFVTLCNYGGFENAWEITEGLL